MNTTKKTKNYKTYPIKQKGIQEVKEAHEHLKLYANKFSKDIKFEKKIVSNRFNKFTQKFKQPYNKTLLKSIPAILLALTVIAVQNKKYLKTISMGYSMASKTFGNTTFIGKVTKIFQSYIQILSNMGKLESMEAGLFLISMFTESIPNIYKNLHQTAHLSPLGIAKSFTKNINDLNKDVVLDIYKNKDIITNQKESIAEKAAENSMQSTIQFMNDLGATDKGLSKIQPTDNKLANDYLELIGEHQKFVKASAESYPKRISNPRSSKSSTSSTST